MKKRLFLIVGFVFILLPLKAQLGALVDSISLVKRKLAHQSVCLLKNRNNTIPVKELNQSIACLSIACDSVNMFQKRLADYTQIAHFNLRKTENDSTISKIKSELGKFDLVIVSFHDIHNSPRKAYGITSLMDKMFSYAVDSLPSVVVIFGNTSSLYQFTDIKKAKVLVVSELDSIANQDFAAQIIFGGMPAIGKLKIDVQDFFKTGDGISTTGKLRFSYQLPEELGLNSTYLYTKLDSVAEYGLRVGAYPGCQILAAKDGAIFFHKTYGFHTYDSIEPVKKNDLYDFASVTKITGPLPALMKLYDERKFQLDCKFSVYWPQMKHSNKKDILVRDVLAHQAKLQAYITFWKNTNKKNGKFKWHTFVADSSKKYPVRITENLFLHKDYKKRMFHEIKKSGILEERKYKYSGLTFLLYPSIIERLTGSDYETYLKENFYQPLGAYSLTFNPLKYYSKSDIIPTEMDTLFRMQQIHGTVHDEAAAMMGGVSGNAGLFGTTLDLAKIMQMYLNMGQYGGVRFISDTTMREFTKCQFPENENRRGLGFDKPLLKNKEEGSCAIDASEESFGHTGFTGTLAWADPQNGILFVFMSNRVYPTRNNSKIYQLNIRPAIHQILYDMFNIKKE